MFEDKGARASDGCGAKARRRQGPSEDRHKREE